MFIAESDLVVRALLESSYPVHALVGTQEAVGKLQPEISAASARWRQVGREFPVYEVPEATLQQVVGFAFHRGVLGAGTRVPEPAPEAMLRDCTSLTILEGISNHDNVGAIFRNAAALGGDRPGVLLGPGCCDPLYRKALRVSIGHVLKVPFAKVDEVERWRALPGMLAKAGWTSYALTPRASAQPLESLGQRSRALGQRPAILLGAEGPGLTDQTLDWATHAVRIPMRGGVDSLNVSVTSALALWALVPITSRGG